MAAAKLKGTQWISLVDCDIKPNSKIFNESTDEYSQRNTCLIITGVRLEFYLTSWADFAWGFDVWITGNPQ